MHQGFWALERFGEQIALHDAAHHEITYRQLAELSDDFADLLLLPAPPAPKAQSAQGTQSPPQKQGPHSPQSPSRRVLVLFLCSNTIAALVAYLAALRHGHVPLLLADSLPLELTQHLIARYRPDFIYAPKQVAANLLASKIADTTLEARPLTTDLVADYELIACGYAGQGQGADESSEADGASDAEAEGRALHPELALLLSTSGSTGSPKLVRVSYQNLQSNAESIGGCRKLVNCNIILQ